MYKITEELKDITIRVLANATHPNLTYQDVQNVLQQLTELEKIQEPIESEEEGQVSEE